MKGVTMRKLTAVLATAILALTIVASASGRQPNPIREYGKVYPHPGPTAYGATFGSGAHRVQ
jgi:hypothetical protein